MFTSQKIGKTVFVSLYFDKIFYHANAMDGMYVNAHKKLPSHKFLVCTSLLFNKNIPQVAARATRLQWLKIEQKHRMTSSTWFRGCPTNWVIGHRTWSIIGHSTIPNLDNVTVNHNISVRPISYINGQITIKWETVVHLRWKMKLAR